MTEKQTDICSLVTGAERGKWLKQDKTGQW